MTQERGRGPERVGSSGAGLQGMLHVHSIGEGKRESHFTFDQESYLCPPDTRVISYCTFWGVGFGKDAAELSALNAGCNGRVIAVAMSPDRYLLQENNWMAVEAEAGIDLFVLFCL